MSAARTMAPGEAWAALARHASAILELQGLPAVSFIADSEVSETRWSNAIDGVAACLQAINADPASHEDWRHHPGRLHFRRDHQSRITVHIMRNRLRRGVISREDAADVLADIGLLTSTIDRVLALPELSPRARTPPSPPPPPPPRDVKGGPKKPSFLACFAGLITRSRRETGG